MLMATQESNHVWSTYSTLCSCSSQQEFEEIDYKLKSKEKVQKSIKEQDLSSSRDEKESKREQNLT